MVEKENIEQANSLISALAVDSTVNLKYKGRVRKKTSIRT